MNSKSRLYGAAGVAALFATTASPVLAAGTAADTRVQNTVNVTYQVGGVTQTTASGSDEFRVDRKIIMTIANQGAAATQVGPGGTGVITFLLTNNSNDQLDFALAASNGGAAKHGTTDNYDVETTPTPILIYREDGAAGFQGTEPTVTSIDDLNADASVTLYVVAKTPGGRVTNDGAVVTLRATATDDGGVALTEGGANTAGVENVLADDLGLTAPNAERRNGSVFDTGDYTVRAAAISAVKTSSVLSDPVNGTTSPKAIPGAVIQYCIAVSNSTGSAPAENVVITDAVPGALSYVTGSIVVAPNCTDAGSPKSDISTDADGANYTGTTVTGTLPNIGAGATQTLRFRATVKQ